MEIKRSLSGAGRDLFILSFVHNHFLSCTVIQHHILIDAVGDLQDGICCINKECLVDVFKLV
jgi:hypothetical protein